MVQGLYVTALVLAVAAGLWVAGAAWTRRGVTGAVPLGGMALAAALWAGGTVGLGLATAPAAKLRWLQFSYLGIVAAPITFVLFALRYTGYSRSRSLSLPGGLCVAGAGFLGLVWTNPRHDLYWASIDYSVAVPAGIATSPGPGFWAFVVFTYGLLLVGSVLLVRYALTAPHRYRNQTAAILVAVAAPWAANVPHSLQFLTADYTPVALSVTTLALWVAVFRYRLTEVGPIALRTVFESISSGVYVLDRDDRVLDVNAAGMELFGADDDVIGTRFGDVAPDDDLVACVRGGGETREVVEVEDAAGARYYEVQVTPADPSGGRHGDCVVVVTDVTEQQRRRDQLEAQNERLSRFASVVSHDLRNPLHVAEARVELAREECDSDHLAHATEAHQRMETLIEELLTLARTGETDPDRETVAIGAFARRCWRTVETADATLETGNDGRVRADPGRLRQLFENLLRNAVEHGGDDVTVRIGTLADGSGFYVADDGPGVPESEREDVFETGYSTGGGTGLGLAIVTGIVNAHGWEVAVTESAEGGARFEITGVERLE